MERDHGSDSQVHQRRRDILERHPSEFPIFPSLHPGIQEYVLLEHQKELAPTSEE